MGTSSRIGVRMDDGTIRSILVNYDGYPSGVGAMLAEHYPTAESFAPVLALGDLRALGPVAGDGPLPPLALFEKPAQCDAWARDHGQRRYAHARVHRDGEDFLAECDNVGYAYLLDAADGWMVASSLSRGRWRDLPTAVAVDRSRPL